MELSEHLIAHRGWQRRYPENTAAAVRGAIAAGARAVEVDLQLSADGVPVLHHDRDLWRVCRHRGEVARLSLAQLQELRASEPDRLGEEFAAEPLLTLAQLVGLLDPHPGVQLFLELKEEVLDSRPADAALAIVLDQLAPLTGRCTLISFSLPLLEAAREQGWPAVGPVLSHWDQRSQPALVALQPRVAFIHWRRLPEQGPLETAWPLAIYEVDQRPFALHLLERGARWIETFAIGELLAEEAGLAQGEQP